MNPLGSTTNNQAASAQATSPSSPSNESTTNGKKRKIESSDPLSLATDLLKAATAKTPKTDTEVKPLNFKKYKKLKIIDLMSTGERRIAFLTDLDHTIVTTPHMDSDQKEVVASTAASATPPIPPQTPQNAPSPKSGAPQPEIATPPVPQAPSSQPPNKTVPEGLSEATEALINRGNSYLAKFKQMEAIQEFNAALALKPDHFEALSSRAMIRYELGLLDAAISDYNTLLKLAPNNGTLLYNRAVIFNQQNKPSETLSDLNTALNEEADNLDALMLRGSLHLKQGNFQDAATDFEKILKLDPQNAAASYNLGYICFNKKLFKEAESHLEVALKASPDDVIILQHRGMVYIELGKFDAALVDFNKILSITPKALIFYKRAYIYLKLNKYALANADCNEALRLAPEKLSVLQLRGTCRLYLAEEARTIYKNNYPQDETIAAEQALGDFNIVLAADPKNIIMLNLRGRAYLILKNFAQAYKDFDQAHTLNKDPTNFQFLINRSVASISLNRALAPTEKQKGLQQDTDDLTQIIKKCPTAIEALLLRGQLYFHEKRDKEALADFNIVLEIDPNNLPACFFRSEITVRHSLKAINLLERALADIQKARHLKQKPIIDHDLIRHIFFPITDEYLLVKEQNIYKLFIERGRIFLKDNKQFELALNDINKAISGLGFSELALENRAEVYRQVGRYDLALNDYNEILLKSKLGSLTNILAKRALVYVKINDIDKARADIKAFLMKNPTDKATINDFYTALKNLENPKATALASELLKFGTTKATGAAELTVVNNAKKTV